MHRSVISKRWVISLALVGLAALFLSTVAPPWLEEAVINHGYPLLAIALMVLLATRRTKSDGNDEQDRSDPERETDTENEDAEPVLVPWAAVSPAL